MSLILIVAIVLIAWSLHLMRQAFAQHELSLMLAGTLVAMAAAATIGVYFVMADYMFYIQEMAQRSAAVNLSQHASPVAAFIWQETENLTPETVELSFLLR